MIIVRDESIEMVRDESVYLFSFNFVDTKYFLMFVKNVQTNQATTMCFEQKKKKKRRIH